jgi:hypothetical protein
VAKIVAPAADAAGDRIDGVLGIGDEIERGEPREVAVRRVLFREDAVGDPHFVHVGRRHEGEQARLLRFPPEAADAALAAHLVVDPRGAPADCVGLRSRLVGEDRTVGNGVDQPGTEERRGQSLGDRVRLERDHLQRPGVDREALEHRAALVPERDEGVGDHASEARDAHRARAAVRGRAVALDAPDGVEDGAEPRLGGADAHELVLSGVVRGELALGEAGERIAGARERARGIDEPAAHRRYRRSAGVVRAARGERDRRSDQQRGDESAANMRLDRHGERADRWSGMASTIRPSFYVSTPAAEQ